MEAEIKKIISGDSDTVTESLNTFIKTNANLFAFDELNPELRADLWKALFTYIRDDERAYLHCLSLAAIRILSRDKNGLNELVTKEYLDVLLQRANLKPEQNDNENYTVVAEALKSLCNIIFQSRVAATISSTNGCLEGIMDRSKKCKNLPVNVKTFHVKLLFLITALCRETREIVKSELHGLPHLIEMLEDALEGESHNSDISSTLSDHVNDLVTEILKVLFNLTIHADLCVNYNGEDEVHYVRLVGVLYKILIVHIENVGQRIELHGHVVNLLTNLPNKCYLSLFVPVQGDVPKDLQYEEQNMNGIIQLFKFIESRFENDVTIQNQGELLLPILIVLLKAVKSSRIIRRYLRLKILPPLKDVHSRPEEGSTVRNSLCRLLTTPITNVRDLVADLLFVLCKENVGRMIKYTGYGNAAGLFAQRGLLAGGGKPTEGLYSSDSEDSDTEEYREHKHGINPVTGCYDQPRPSPTMNMTEEQKEYEAMQLVKLMDNLTRQGIMQPCRIGEDGRPQPIEHVSQLQESLLNDQPKNLHEHK